MTTANFSPCPWCGNTNLRTKIYGCRGKWMAYVLCVKDQVFGPEVKGADKDKTRIAAIEAWNEREEKLKEAGE